MKILVVEDEPLVQKSLAKLLTKKGADVICCSSGTKAIEELKVGNFDKIICDLMLSDITGFDVIEESKNYYSREEIRDRFTIITAYSSPQVIEKATEYGCTIINKPFNSLSEAIDSILS